jgi:hypothetical protein
MSDVLTALQDDFKLFLQALWEQLDLPSPTRAQYAIADYFPTETNHRNTMAKTFTAKERRQQMVSNFFRRSLLSSSGSQRKKCRDNWAAYRLTGRPDDSGRHRSSRQQYDGVDA